MKPINEIRALFNVIKTETRRWFNTGARIDEVGQEILDHIEHLEQQFPLELSHNTLTDKNGEVKFRHVDLLYTKQTLLENDKLVVWDSNTNEVILARKSSISHRDINYKNGELYFQHIDTTTTKETLVEADKVTIYDSVTGKVVLTDKNNVGGFKTYDAETVSAPANAGTLTLKNATETVISTTLTNSNSFTIALPTATAGKVNESILIFKTGATLPALTQPTGVVYRTETPVVAINQTWTFCYERVSFDGGSTFEIYVSATKNV